MPKISIQIFPTIKDILSIFSRDKSEKINIFSQYNDYFLLSRSSTSIEIICKCLIEKKHRKINIWIPQYFCGETLNSIRYNEQVELVFYPITTNLEPDYKACAELCKNNQADLFLFVHYFGNFCDVAAAKNFCKLHNSILVEDCAHVCYPDGKLGSMGDYVIFSPHKCLPVIDGAVLCLNQSANIDDRDVAFIRNYVNELPRAKTKKQYFLSLIKEILGVKADGTYSPIEHYDSIKSYYLGHRISLESAAILKRLDDSTCRKIKYYRKKNLLMLIELLQKYKNNIRVVNKLDDCNIPYIGVFEIVDRENSDVIINKIKNEGFPVGTWTYLPYEIKNSDASVAKECSKYYFTIPIHQEISEQELVRKFSQIKNNKINTNFNIVPFQGSEDEWSSLMGLADSSPITQDFYYGEAKSKADNLICKRYLIYKESKTVGIVQTLEKHFLGIKIVRVNKGPLLFDTDIETNISAIYALKRRFSMVRRSCLIISPNQKYEPLFIKDMIELGFRKLNYTDKYTSFVDLSQSEDSLRKNLKAKWRNQLKTAEKMNQVILEGTQSFDYYMDLYQNFMKEKSFSGIPIEYLKGLHQNNSQNLKIYCDFLENELIAFDIIYIHGNAATYLVGWENEAGRKIYANNFLIYYAMILLKKEKVHFLDLGGLGLISAPSIAKFKMGISNDVTEYSGEFFSC